MGKKRPRTDTTEVEAVTKLIKKEKRNVIVLLEQASLETIQVAGGREHQLLNPDKHRDRILKANRDISAIRPDITHQCLLMLLDSPLNRVGKLKVYIRTCKNIIIEVSSKCRIPRTFDRFAGLMSQLLQKLSITAAEGSHEKLLRVVKNPISIHFPPNSLVVGLSHNSEQMLTFDDLPNLEPNGTHDTLVFIIGAIAHGSINTTCSDIVNQTVSISRFPLSAAQVCDRICQSFEKIWNVEDYLKE
ncbi:18S rRNA pseudouridine methyltransferase [Cichlidogyrus casuarinus]|uniref:18S rRNA pseudouridine methyltransferase n=1 Tax=Cichlidogyrus casuarinus TaxID=1844966 RepID=A0ABD2QJN0_9PLAT